MERVTPGCGAVATAAAVPRYNTSPASSQHGISGMFKVHFKGRRRQVHAGKEF